MKNSIVLPLVAAITASSPSYSAEVSNKESLKTGAETVVNGAALIGVVGAMSGSKNGPSYEGRKAGARTWTELGDMHRAARPGVAEFGK